MDIVFLRGLRVDTVIGVHEWERRIRQQVTLDLELGCDIRPAAASDSIADAVDYQAIAERVIEFVAASEFRLVEALAERIAAIVLAEFPVRWLRLTLGKPGAVSAAQSVGVVIERGERN